MITPPTPFAPSPEPPASRRFPLVVPMLLLIVLMAALDMTALSVAMPLIVSGLRNGLDFYAWPFFLYMAVFTLSMPLWGKCAGLAGRLPILVLGGALYATGAWIGTLATEFVIIVTSRVILGIGLGAMFAMAMSLIADRPSRRLRQAAVVVSVLGSLLGAPLCWWLVQQDGWQALFRVQQGLGIVIAVWAVLTVRAGRMPSIPFAHRIYGQLSRSEAGFFTLFAMPATLMASGLIGMTPQAGEAETPLGIPRQPGFATAALISTLMGAVTVTMLVFLPIHLQGVLGLPLRQTVIALIVIGAAVWLGQAVAGPLSRPGSHRLIVGTGLAMTTAGAAAVARQCHGSPLPTPEGFLATLALFGCGLGIAHIGLVAYVRHRVPHASQGTAMGLFMFARSIGGPFGTGLIGGLLAAMTGLSTLPYNHLNQLLGPLHGSDLLPRELTGFLPLLHAATIVMHWTIAGLAGFTLLLALLWRGSTPPDVAGGAD